MVHPLNISALGMEGFKTDTEQSITYKFSGTRWTSDQVRTFRETIQQIVTKFDQIQSDLYMTLQEYRTLDGSILENAKTKKAEILKNEAQIKEASEPGPIPGLTTSDPVEDYYKSLKVDKKDDKVLPLASTAEVSARTGLQYEIPKIVLPDTSTLTKQEEYAWIDLPDGKERYDMEQKFYVTVASIIPILQKAIGELYVNANILRISAGSKTYSLLPRVEAIQKEIDTQESLAKSVGNVSEGFQPHSKESRICTTQVMYQAEDYSKWITKVTDMVTIIQQAEDLIQKAENDIRIAKRIMGEINKKGEEQRARIRKLRLTRQSRIE